MKNFNLAVLTITFLLAFTSRSINAAIIVFDSSIHRTNSFSYSLDEGAFTADFFNPVNEADGRGFWYFERGLFIGSSATTLSFDVMFNQDVVWSEYDRLFFTDEEDLGVTLVGNGVSISNLFQGSTNGTNSFVSPITFLANEVYRFTSNYHCEFSVCGGYVVNNLVINLAEQNADEVPAPSTLILLIMGLASIRLARRKNTSCKPL
ncbi:PEP-CTERM protein-sorting domain-containing protein [Rheinheimera pacifica]|uniref:PEP-CTERM protein-sorting domain-containing protein n=1 Tax=Rheinheimera pacifica TaxID=173990 RepID=A0A1H6N9V4_9GAMM|nr:PEP-CTERM sorting domain-containing protein [Rheinheimera pacifica]SEI09568.1 PEP-CTERM protein-sorting domain-containing protein [Rheinheimera pacifica]